MQLQPHQPIHELLKPHIDFYYFLQTPPDFESTYYAFPHTHTVLNIHRHAEAGIGPGYTFVNGTVKVNHLSLIQRMRDKPMLIKLRGKLDKVTIAFKPLGLNHFINKPLGEVATSDSLVFGEWNENTCYHDFVSAFFASGDTIVRISLLEKFLISVYQPFEHAKTLSNALAHLHDFDEKASIETIAAEVGLQPRTLNRLFKKHLAITPVGFRTVARFRHSLGNRLVSEQFKRLTEIGYESNFYDQSYFIRIYQKMTGSNPGAFFSSIEKMGDDKILFRFINR